MLAFTGNSNKLNCEADRDLLVGTYYQPAVQQQFDVYLERRGSGARLNTRRCARPRITDRGTRNLRRRIKA